MRITYIVINTYNKFQLFEVLVLILPCDSWLVVMYKYCLGIRKWESDLQTTVKLSARATRNSVIYMAIYKKLNQTPKYLPKMFFFFHL